jgi:hypothetical protein
MHSVAERVTKNCDTCQRQKIPGPQYGHLPPQNSDLLPWEDVALDLIGPWTVNAPQESYEFYALTCINIVTNFPDAIQLHNKTASHVQMQFKNLWLSRYPRPIWSIHDCGTEFMGANFQRILQHFGIKDVSTSVRNPQSNAVCKRLHQSVGNALHIFLSQATPFNVTNVAKLVDSALATALHASHATIHHTLGMTPGATIVFNRNMFLNIPLLMDFHLLQTCQQAVVDDNLCQSNQKRRQHNYQPGNGCLILDHKATKKLDTRFMGPFTIVHTHVNGTLMIQCAPHVTD